MSEKLFLQFQSHQSDPLLWFYVFDSNLQDQGTVTADELSDLKAQYSSSSVIILVPSIDCLVTTVTLPTRQRRQQLKAIPFALEDQIADNIESIHFAIGTRRDDGLLPVIAVAKEKMDFWLTTLEQASITPQSLLPESALLESPNDVWSIFQHQDSFIVNQDGNCWSGNSDEATMMLQLSIQTLDEDGLPNLLFWGESETPGWVSALGLECSHQIINHSQQSLLSRFESASINLLQGEYSIRDDWQAGWKVWRRVALFAIVAILLKFTMMGFDVFRLTQQQDYLKKEITKAYHQVAPGARIVDPRKQMRSLLAKSQGGSNSARSFLTMLSMVGEGLATIPDIKPTNIAYDSNRGEIRLDLLISNLPLLDRLKENLARKGLSIEVGAANAQGNSYSGRLIIRSGS